MSGHKYCYYISLFFMLKLQYIFVESAVVIWYKNAEVTSMLHVQSVFIIGNVQ